MPLRKGTAQTNKIWLLLHQQTAAIRQKSLRGSKSLRSSPSADAAGLKYEVCCLPGVTFSTEAQSLCLHLAFSAQERGGYALSCHVYVHENILCCCTTSSELNLRCLFFLISNFSSFLESKKIFPSSHLSLHAFPSLYDST